MNVLGKSNDKTPAKREREPRRHVHNGFVHEYCGYDVFFNEQIPLHKEKPNR